MTFDDFIICSLGFAAACWFAWDAWCRTQRREVTP